MFLLVGLGNPGEEYAGTRHNLGFMVVDQISRKFGVSFRITRSKALMADVYRNQERILLAKPQTFVNQSGESIKTIADWFSLDSSGLLVIHDDLDIPFGEIKFKEGSGSGGHKGIESMIEYLGTKDFKRLRVGIGRPPGRKDPTEYVLEPFTNSEREELASIIENAADTAIEIAEAYESSISPSPS
jgi:PTH1 family peptidyl-tRNA hydrolase